MIDSVEVPTSSPLPSMDFAGRRTRIAEAVARDDLDGIHLTDPADLQWATGYTGSNGALLVRADGRATFTTDARYEGRVTPTPLLDVVIDRDLFATTAQAAADGERIGFDPVAVTHARALAWHDRTDHRIVAHGGVVASLRRCKDRGEIARLERACAITVAAWRDIVVAGGADATLVGWTEHAVAVAIERRMVDLGADGIAFDSIIAAGPHGAVPHHEPTDRPIQPGEFVTTDIGALVEGYHADFTRTVALPELAAPTLARLHDIHELVARAQQAGIDSVQVGAPIVDVDTAARDVIDAGGHGDHFVHGVGHGVGLAIHEDPFIALADGVLEAGMCVTVEPGIYVAGLGGVRIEDTVVVTSDGPRLLTLAPTTARPWLAG